MAKITEIFATYHEAAAVCGEGYRAADIATVTAWRTSLLARRLPGSYIHPDFWTMQVMAASMAGAAAKTVRVLDFGGGCGLHYHCVKALMPGIALRWAVVDTDSMAAAARAGLQDAGLAFFTAIGDALAYLGGCDVVNASGAIQYVPAPEAMLRDLLGVGASHFVLARFPAFRGARCVGIQTAMLSQHLPGPMLPGMPDREVRYPVTFTPLAQVIPILAARYGRMEEVPSTTCYEVNGRHVAGATFLFGDPVPHGVGA